MSIKLNGGLSLKNVSMNGAWSVRSLFKNNEVGAQYEAVAAHLTQDVAGTTPITTPGQFVARATDLSGNDLHAVQPDSTRQFTYRNVSDVLGFGAATSTRVQMLTTAATVLDSLLWTGPDGVYTIAYAAAFGVQIFRQKLFNGDPIPRVEFMAMIILDRAFTGSEKTMVTEYLETFRIGIPVADLIMETTSTSYSGRAGEVLPGANVLWTFGSGITKTTINPGTVPTAVREMVLFTIDDPTKLVKLEIYNYVVTPVLEVKKYSNLQRYWAMGMPTVGYHNMDQAPNSLTYARVISRSPWNSPHCIYGTIDNVSMNGYLQLWAEFSVETDFPDNFIKSTAVSPLCGFALQYSSAYDRPLPPVSKFINVTDMEFAFSAMQRVPKAASLPDYTVNGEPHFRELWSWGIPLDPQAVPDLTKLAKETAYIGNSWLLSWDGTRDTSSVYSGTVPSVAGTSLVGFGIADQGVTGYTDINVDTYYLDFWKCSFPQTEVDSLLNDLVTARTDLPPGTWWYVDLDGAGMAIPSATGQADAATLRARGWEVYVSSATKEANETKPMTPDEYLGNLGDWTVN